MRNLAYKELEEQSKELQLLIMLLSNDLDEKVINHKENYRNIDWNLFIELSLHHRVFPTVYLKIKRHLTDFIPIKVVQQLQKHYQKNVYRMLQLSGETENIAKKLDENRIRTLFLKGPVLAAHLYTDISMRTSADIDLLVHLDDLGLVEKKLITLGYKKDDYFSTVLNDWKWRHHHVTFFHSLKKSKVEVHWRLNPGPAKEPSFDELWSRKQLSTISNTPINILGNEDLFLFLSTHGARHGWSRLRWLVDISLMHRLEIDWAFAKKLLEKNQYLHIGAQALILSSKLLNTAIPIEFKKAAEKNRSKRLAKDALFYIEQMVNLHTEPVPVEISKYHQKHLFSLMSSQQKVIFILSFLIPFPEDVQVLPLPRFLHFLYFPLRPFLWAWRRTRKQVVQ